MFVSFSDYGGDRGAREHHPWVGEGPQGKRKSSQGNKMVPRENVEWKNAEFNLDRRLDLTWSNQPN